MLTRSKIRKRERASWRSKTRLRERVSRLPKKKSELTLARTSALHDQLFEVKRSLMAVLVLALRFFNWAPFQFSNMAPKTSKTVVEKHDKSHGYEFCGPYVHFDNYIYLGLQFQTRRIRNLFWTANCCLRFDIPLQRYFWLPSSLRALPLDSYYRGTETRCWMACRRYLGSGKLGCICEGAGILFAQSDTAPSAARRGKRGGWAFEWWQIEVQIQ